MLELVANNEYENHQEAIAIACQQKTELDEYCMLIRDHRGVCLYVSENVSEVLGLPGGEIKGKTVVQMLPAELAARVLQEDMLSYKTKLKRVNTYQLDISNKQKNYQHIRIPLFNSEESIYFQVDIIKEQKEAINLPASHALVSSYTSLLNEIYHNTQSSLKRDKPELSFVLNALNYCLNKVYQNKQFTMLSWQQLSRGNIAEALSNIDIQLSISLMCRPRMFWYLHASVLYLQSLGHLFKRYVRDSASLKINVSKCEVSLAFISSKRVQFSEIFTQFGEEAGIQIEINQDKQEWIVVFREVNKSGNAQQ